MIGRRRPQRHRHRRVHRRRPRTRPARRPDDGPRRPRTFDPRRAHVDRAHGAPHRLAARRHRRCRHRRVRARDRADSRTSRSRGCGFHSANRWSRPRPPRVLHRTDTSVVHAFAGGDLVLAITSASHPAPASAAAAPPSATTGSPSSVGQSSATVNGTVNPNGQSTTYYFKYGTTTTYGLQTSPQRRRVWHRHGCRPRGPRRTEPQHHIPLRTRGHKLGRHHQRPR